MNRKGILILLGTVAMANLNVMHAQDLRERTYYYEILSPNHQEKPDVVGFANFMYTKTQKGNVFA